jgi:signal transduction histidine kinase
MANKNISIRSKLMRIIMLICGIVVLMACIVFFLYDFYSFRKSTLQNISTYGQIISANSTAALAFESKEDAEEILGALKAEPHIVTASIYDANGQLFCVYPANYNSYELPVKPGAVGYHFTNISVEGFQPIVQGGKRLGTLYLKSDLGALYSRFKLYAIIMGLILNFSFILTFVLSKFLQRGVSAPILALAETAKAISEQKDYSVKVTKLSNDEVGLLTDAFNQMLTQIHEQTEILNAFNQTLEQRVKDRTIELEAANKELESFSYSVSHDLRAPARAVHSYANVFLEDYGDKLDDEAKRLINIILKSGKKMGLLIDDLLAFSQLGRKELIKTKLSMNEIAQGVWTELYKAEENRNITFTLKQLPDAYAERTTIQQVWVNLISNALKYTRKKAETCIEISAEEKNGELIYCIKDNGSGFDMKYYNKLFGVFQRLHAQEEFEGTGVGLAIVERIISRHGGKIWAEGVVNEGATFYFSLPVLSK